MDDNKFVDIFWENLKKYIDSRPDKPKQETIAKILEMDHGAYRAMISKRPDLSLKKAVHISNKLNIPLNELIGSSPVQFKDQKMLSLYKKYEKVIDSLEVLDPDRRRSVEEMIAAYAGSSGAALQRDSG